MRDLQKENDCFVRAINKVKHSLPPQKPQYTQQDSTPNGGEGECSQKKRWVGLQALREK